MPRRGGILRENEVRGAKIQVDRWRGERIGDREGGWKVERRGQGRECDTMSVSALCIVPLLTAMLLKFLKYTADNKIEKEEEKEEDMKNRNYMKHRLEEVIN